MSTFNGLLVTVAANFQAAGKNITVVDLNTNFPADGLTGDGVHPNETGYNWMADRWYDALVSLYGAPTTPPVVPTGLTTIHLDGSVVLAWSATPEATRLMNPHPSGSGQDARSTVVRASSRRLIGCWNFAG